MEPREIVALGYDEVYERYEQWRDDTVEDVRLVALERALANVASLGRALDLGCGTGAHATRHLADRFEHVTAVDISAKSIESARACVPGVEFVVGDMATVELPDASFDLVAAFFSIIHVPAADQPALFHRIAGWLAPGGVLVCTLAAHAGDQYEDFLGAPMFWSGLEPSASVAAVEAAGLRVITADVATQMEHGNAVSFLWLTARAP